MKSVFCPASLLERAKRNISRYPWAASLQREIVEAAESWVKLSDDELWAWMFGNTITRSWMVWSNGHCPSCGKGVPMYDWNVDPFAQPWKVRCPHCHELFPKNDFHAFYRSGLDERGLFDPSRANRALLFNVEHPDRDDPLRGYGVDDGEGYVEGGKRWRFIGAYLIYGQWKHLILGGIEKLAAAYLVTARRLYAHKAGVLLDRVADLYPTFDFEKEGLAYEKGHGSGYVSTWHDACVETRALALAYDQVREGLQGDEDLVAFLSEKSRRHTGIGAKDSVRAIARNIEDRIFRDAIANRHKIVANTPQTDITISILKTVLSWPDNRQEVLAMQEEILKVSTAVDGVTGEKGLCGYTAWAVYGVAVLLALYARVDPNWLRELSGRHPALYDMFRFHIDTWCIGKYYPLVGDTGFFAQRANRYMGTFAEILVSKNQGISPSMYTFLWQLFEATGDLAFVQALYRTNGGSVEGLPHDLFAEDAESFRKAVTAVIEREGAEIALGSVNKQKWHLAILRSGKGEDARALWVNYETGGPHGHADGMNIGLFAKGLDLLPDLGYPPVAFGGWHTAETRWYRMSASHNTVVVDGPWHATGEYSHVGIGGTTALWADGKQLKAIRVRCAEMIKGSQFERTLVMVDLSARDSYIADVFRVVGGTDHAKFVHSQFGSVTTRGLSLKQAEDYGQETKMRHFLCDPTPRPGWSADWKIEDRFGYLPKARDVHLRYTDLTMGAAACTCDGWVYGGGVAVDRGRYEPSSEIWWIPRLMVRRRAPQGPLASTFVSVIEAYEQAPNIARIQRLDLDTDANAAVEVRHAGGCDLLVLVDCAAPKPVVQRDWAFESDGELCYVRKDATGIVQRVALCRGSFLAVGNLHLELKELAEVIEVSFEGGQAAVVTGKPGVVSRIRA